MYQNKPTQRAIYGAKPYEISNYSFLKSWIIHLFTNHSQISCYKQNQNAWIVHSQTKCKHTKPCYVICRQREINPLTSEHACQCQMSQSWMGQDKWEEGEAQEQQLDIKHYCSKQLQETTAHVLTSTWQTRNIKMLNEFTSNDPLRCIHQMKQAKLTIESKDHEGNKSKMKHSRKESRSD